MLCAEEALNVPPYPLKNDQKGQDVKDKGDGLRRDGGEDGEKQTLVWKTLIVG